MAVNVNKGVLLCRKKKRGKKKFVDRNRKGEDVRLNKGRERVLLSRKLWERMLPGGKNEEKRYKVDEREWKDVVW